MLELVRCQPAAHLTNTDSPVPWGLAHGCRCSSCLILINEGQAHFPASERKKPLVLHTRGFMGWDYYGRLAGRLMTPPPSAGS